MEEVRTSNPKKMKASIIIPTYNRSDVIIRSLETWTKQSLSEEDFEIIVVDNNSTDNSPKLIQEFIQDKPNFHYLLEKQKGSTYARHAGARVAKSDILIFCDDDGLYNPECVAEVLKVYAMNNEVAAVACKIDILWDKEPPTWMNPYLFMLGKLDYGDEVCFRYDLYLNSGILSIQKKVFEELGGFNPDLMGDYLVGDGDTGLVIKLHEAKQLIGWTPFATMKHLQLVDKQGTVADIGRRFYNTGISNTYGLYRKQDFHFNAILLKSIFISTVFFLKKGIEYQMKRDKKSFFSFMQKKGELAFWLNLRHKAIRIELKQKNSYIQ